MWNFGEDETTVREEKSVRAQLKWGPRKETCG